MKGSISVLRHRFFMSQIEDGPSLRDDVFQHEFRAVNNTDDDAPVD